MNTDALHYSTRSTFSTIAAIANRIRGFFVRRQPDHAEMPARTSLRQGDLLRNLPVEEKLRLGMYHFMD